MVCCCVNITSHKRSTLQFLLCCASVCRKRITLPDTQNAGKGACFGKDSCFSPPSVSFDVCTETLARERHVKLRLMRPQTSAQSHTISGESVEGFFFFLVTEVNWF